MRRIDREVLLDEWAFFRDHFDYTPDEMARHLGMTPVAFERAIQRAASTGDTRATT